MNKKALLRQGMRAGETQMYREDKIWSRYSDDKVDVGEELARVLRTLQKALPLSVPLRALSIGSSNEPQFRTLQAVCQGGLYLLDVEKGALDVIRERISRQHTQNVIPLQDDYTKIFLDASATRRFVREELGGKKVHLITLHHSLYYCPAAQWPVLMRNLLRHVLAPQGALHATLMASRSNNPYTTTWLYNHYAGKCFGHANDQSLRALRRRLRAERPFARCRIGLRTSMVRALVKDFGEFMAMIWMILLYPNVHAFTPGQRRGITEDMLRKFYLRGKPLLQEQDHLILTRGLPFRGLV